MFYRSLLKRSPADAGSGGSPAAAVAAPNAPAPAPQEAAPGGPVPGAAAPPGSASGGSPGSAARPENVPEQFWDAEKSAVREEALLKSYGELSSKIGKHRDVVKAEVLKEMRAHVPEKAEDYKIGMPEGTVVPKGYEVKFDEKSPMFTWWRDVAHKRGLSQEEFTEGVGKYLSAQMEMLPKGEEEMRRLGPQAEARITRVDQWLAKRLPETHYRSLVKFSVYGDFVEALEGLMESTGAPPMTDDAVTTGEGVVSIESLRTKMKDARYWNPAKRDPAYVKEIEDGWKQIRPGARRG